MNVNEQKALHYVCSRFVEMTPGWTPERRYDFMHAYVMNLLEDAKAKAREALKELYDYSPAECVKVVQEVLEA